MFSIKINCFYFFVLFLSLFLFSSCSENTDLEQVSEETNLIELSYYKMFDDASVIEPLIRSYEDSHPGVKIHYKQFVDLEEYMELVVREISDGEGPDIFSMPNTWFASNYRSLSPMPSKFGEISVFKDIFIDQVSDDMVYYDDFSVERVYGFPMYLDSLALYYNKEHFDEAGIDLPSDTWEGIMVDSLLLQNLGFTPIALGRSDNITRAVDVLYLLFLQYGIDFYNNDYSDLDLAKKIYLPLAFFSEFSYPNYDYDLNEIDAFARGELSMLLDYSYAYELILNRINLLESWGIDSIDSGSFAIVQAPQLYALDSSSFDMIAYSNYFSETVSLNSEYPDIAWDFVLSLVSEESLDYYYDETHKVSSRRDMIVSQQEDPIYGVFAKQAAYSRSFPLFDSFFLSDAFSSLISSFGILSDYEERLLEIQNLFSNSFFDEVSFLPWIE